MIRYLIITLGILVCSTGIAENQETKPDDTAKSSSPAKTSEQPPTNEDSLISAVHSLTTKLVASISNTKPDDSEIQGQKDYEESQKQTEIMDKDLDQQIIMAKHTEYQTWIGWIAIVISGIAAGATVVGLIFIYRTLKATEVAANASETAAEASKLAAEETKKSVLVMTDTAKRQLRAYICVETLDIDDSGLPGAGKVVFKNTGVTPGYVTDSLISCQFLASEHTDFNNDDKGPERSKALIAPGQTISKTYLMETNLSEPDIKEYLFLKKSFFVFGYLKYLDIFNEQHQTNFRYSVNQINNVGRVRPCEEGNEAI